MNTQLMPISYCERNFVALPELTLSCIYVTQNYTASNSCWTLTSRNGPSSEEDAVAWQEKSQKGFRPISSSFEMRSDWLFPFMQVQRTDPQGEGGEDASESPLTSLNSVLMSTGQTVRD